jgi:glycosyltransferase involved in cell wall biosynthesis
MDLVSIIIPNYNREVLVAETVQNMLDQDYPEKEIIVIDDGSTDGSVDRLREFGEAIKVVQQKNQGPGAARNNGLKIAKGKYIQFMDNDDLASKNKISRQMECLHRNKADAVYSPWGKFQIQESTIILDGMVLQSQEIPTSAMIPAMLEGWSTVLQTYLFKREFLDKIGPFKTDVSYLEDIDYLVRIVLNNAVMAFESAPLVIYRNNSTDKLSATGADSIKKSKADAEFFNSFIAHLQRHVPPKFKQLKNRLAFRTANTYYILKDHPDLLESLDHMMSLKPSFPSPWRVRAIKKVRQYKAGLKHRIYGSRYNRLFYPQQLSERQKQLISDLGFKDIISSEI